MDFSKNIFKKTKSFALKHKVWTVIKKDLKKQIKDLDKSLSKEMEKTMNFWLISTLVGWLIKPAQVPCVYLRIFWANNSPPSIFKRTNSKSERIGGIALVRSDSGVMSREA